MDCLIVYPVVVVVDDDDDDDDVVNVSWSFF